MGATTSVLTFEEFEHLPEAPGKRELLDGELIELPPPKRKHSIVQHRLSRAMQPHGDALGLLVIVEVGFRLGKREWVQPDVSVVTPEQEERAAGDPDGYFEGAPLIAVEVISPAKMAEAIERKLVKYFENGAGEVWVVYPKTRRIWRYTGLKTNALVVDDVLTSPLLPGFELSLAELFRSL